MIVCLDFISFLHPHGLLVDSQLVERMSLGCGYLSSYSRFYTLDSQVMCRVVQPL